MKFFPVVCVCACMFVAILPSDIQAISDFNESGDGDLANSLNWSRGLLPAGPIVGGFFRGAGDIETFLSSDIDTAGLGFVRPFGQFRLDLRDHVLKSYRLDYRPSVSSIMAPQTAGLDIFNGTLQSDLRIESAVPDFQPQTIYSSFSNVDWTANKWEIYGKPSPSATALPGYEQSGKVEVTIDQGSQVTVERLIIDENARVNVTGPNTKLSYRRASVLAWEIKKPSTLDVFRGVATLRAENGLRSRR